MDIKTLRVAHHEAGHLVIAAVVGRTLAIDAMVVDSGEMGRSTFDTRPGNTDAEKVTAILATEAGPAAQRELNIETCCPEPPFLWDDDFISEAIIKTLSADYVGTANPAMVKRCMERKANDVVKQHWHMIKSLASALLGKTPEALRPREQSDRKHQFIGPARYLNGYEVAAILSQCGIAARVQDESTFA